MGWARVIKAVGDPTDPLRDHQIETLAGKISAALSSASTLDHLVIMRKHGRGGWQATDLAISPDPDDEDPDPREAADELLRLIDGHAQAEGDGDYQIRAIGLNSRGNPCTLFSLHIPKGGEKHASEKEIEGGDILRSAKEMVAALTNVNSSLLGNIARIGEQAEKGYEIAQKASSTLVELRRVELEHEDKRMEREYEARDADREAELSKERMRHGMGVLAMVGDGFLAKMNADAHKAAAQAGVDARTVSRGDGVKTGLSKIFDTLTDDEKAQAKTAVGDDVWDMFTAALQKDDANERSGVLKAIASKINALPDDEKKRRGDALIAAIGEQRAFSLLMLLKAAEASP